MSVFHHPPSREALEQLYRDIRKSATPRDQPWAERTLKVLEAFYQKHAYLERPAFPGAPQEEEALRWLANYIRQVRDEQRAQLSPPQSSLRETIEVLCEGVERLLKYVAYLEGPLGDALAAGELEMYDIGWHEGQVDGLSHGLVIAAQEVERFLERHRSPSSLESGDPYRFVAFAEVQRLAQRLKDLQRLEANNQQLPSSPTLPGDPA